MIINHDTWIALTFLLASLPPSLSPLAQEQALQSCAALSYTVSESTSGHFAGWMRWGKKRAREGLDASLRCVP